MPDLCLVNCNYATHSSIITVLISYTLQCDYSTNTLCMQLQCQYAVHWKIDLLSVLLLFCISKLHLVQAGLSTRVADHTCAWIHMCKNGGYHNFMYLCPVVISNSISLSEYWHKHPTSKLSLMSCSSALILTYIIIKPGACRLQAGARLVS